MTTQATRDSVSLGKVGDEAEEAKAELVDVEKNEGEADDVVDLAKVAIARSIVVAADPADGAVGNEAAAVEGEGKSGEGREEGEAGGGGKEEEAAAGSVEAEEKVGGGASDDPGDKALVALNAGVDKVLHQEYHIDGKIVNPTPCLSFVYQL